MQKILGQMYVAFAIPMVSKSWPLIMVHGGGYTGSALEGTAGGSEGWADYTVRHGIPTFVVDQAGRGRSGFDQTLIHEGEALIASNQAAAMDLIPNLGDAGSRIWTSWYGHIVPEPAADITTGQMVRMGAPALQSDGTPAPGQDPQCATEPAHCSQLGRIPMEPEAPWAVDQAIAARTGNGAPAGLGTVVPHVGGHVNPAFPLNDRYLAMEAFKFVVPNAESTLPGEFCPGCTIRIFRRRHQYWTPKALAELVAGLGGAVIATHSQSGIMGHQAARYLKQNGKLHLLKGLMTIEGVVRPCSGRGLTAGRLCEQQNPLSGVQGRLFRPGGPGIGPDPVCRAAVDAINAAGGKAEYIQLDQPGPWQGSYAGPFGPAYVGPFAGVSHMMMVESNPHLMAEPRTSRSWTSCWTGPIRIYQNQRPRVAVMAMAMAMAMAMVLRAACLQDRLRRSNISLC